MPGITYCTEINCSPQDLWPWLEEPEKQKQWMKGLVSNETTSGDGKSVGSTALLKIKEGGKISDYALTVTAYDKPNHLAVSMTGGCSPKHPMTMTAAYKLTDLGGRTRLDYENECIGSGAMFKVMSIFFKPMAKMMIKGFFKKLKSLAEAQEAEATA